MRTSLLLIASLFIFQVSFAQLINFGVRAGISSGSIEPGDLLAFSPEAQDSLRIKAENASVGFRFGLFTRINLPMLYIQPEVLIRTSSTEYSINEVNAAINTTREEDFLSLDIPILVGTKLGPLRVQAGPNISILLDEESELTTREGLGREFDDARWGLQAGLGLDIWKLAFDVNYQFNLSSEQNEVEIGGSTFELNGEDSFFIVGVAYIFNKE